MQHCQKLLSSFIAVRGSYADAAIALAEDWIEASINKLGLDYIDSSQLDWLYNCKFTKNYLMMEKSLAIFHYIMMVYDLILLMKNQVQH